jgi:hypothetical protein
MFFAKFRKQPCFINRLPDEVLVEEIMLTLGIEDIIALRRVCVNPFHLWTFNILMVSAFTRLANFSTSSPTSPLFGRHFYAP